MMENVSKKTGEKDTYIKKIHIILHNACNAENKSIQANS